MKAIALLVPASCCLAVLRRPLSGFACATRTALLYILAFVVSAISADACGISWIQPTTPMDSKYRFQYWTSLGEVGLGKSKQAKETNIPLYLGFNPAFSFPSLLGAGWSLPIFESRIEWSGADTAILLLPDGQRGPLERMKKNKRRLGGNGWVAEISGRQVTCKASCGWTLVFLDNRLVSMSSPDGVQMDLVVGADRSRSWVTGGRTLISIKPDFDKKTTQKIHHLRYGGESALLRMGMRPVFVKEGGKNSGKKAREKLVQTESLVSIEFNDPVKKLHRYNCQKDSLRTNETVFKWNPENQELVQVGDVSYSQVTIEGVRCLKEVDGKGRIQLSGTRIGRAMTVSKDFEEKDIKVQEYIPLPRRGLLEVPRRLYKIRPNGEKFLAREYWYNEQGEAYRAYVNEDGKAGGRYVIKTEGMMRILDPQKQVLLTVKYNPEGKISAIEANKRKIRLEYSNTNVRLIVEDDGTTYEKRISKAEVELLLKKTFPLLQG
jgi:hypothetical protein